MSKWRLTITAHVNDECMVVFSKDYDYNRTAIYKSRPVFKMICELMPCIEIWDEDDGDDHPGTSYCQYTNYEPGTDNYLQAAWNEIDENGCIQP